MDFKWNYVSDVLATSTIYDFSNAIALPLFKEQILHPQKMLFVLPLLFCVRFSKLYHAKYFPLSLESSWWQLIPGLSLWLKSRLNPSLVRMIQFSSTHIANFAHPRLLQVGKEKGVRETRQSQLKKGCVGTSQHLLIGTASLFVEKRENILGPAISDFAPARVDAIFTANVNPAILE